MSHETEVNKNFIKRTIYRRTFMEFYVILNILSKNV